MDEFDDASITARIRAMAEDGEVQPIRTAPGPVDYLSSALQTGLALGTTYVSRRMDIDLQSRVTGSMPAGAAVRRTTQPLVADHADLTTRAVASAGGVRLGDVLPWLAAAGLAWLFLMPKR